MPSSLSYSPPFLSLFLIDRDYFFCSHDDKVACQMILDKKGLKGYQVIIIVRQIYCPDHAIFSSDVPPSK